QPDDHRDTRRRQRPRAEEELEREQEHTGQGAVEQAAHRVVLGAAPAHLGGDASDQCLEAHRRNGSFACPTSVSALCTMSWINASMSTASASPSKFRMMRWRRAGADRVFKSSTLTLWRPSASARTLAPRISDWAPRGLAPSP